jgi:hypothetical protein
MEYGVGAILLGVSLLFLSFMLLKDPRARAAAPALRRSPARRSHIIDLNPRKLDADDVLEPGWF